MAKILHIDFETRSDLDLRKVGTHLYARGKNTEVMCMAFAFDDEPVQCWVPTQLFPKEIIAHTFCGGQVWAHNATFEFEVWNSCLAPKLHLPKLLLEQMVCTMAMAYSMALPGSLDGCAAALGVEQRKDLVGGRLMLQMSKPRDTFPDGKIIWWDEPDKMEKLIAYCVQDVVVEREVGKRMLSLSPKEKELWVLDQVINSRGVKVDVKAILNSMIMVEKVKDDLDAEMRKITGNRVATCNAVQQIKDYLSLFGVGADSIDKASIRELLQENIHPLAKKVLELRASAGKAALAKFEPMFTSAGDDHRVRGCFQYSGANTRRWAGRRIQLHNLKRPTFKYDVVEEILEDIRDGRPAEFISLAYGPPLEVLSECVRSFLIADAEKDLIACDFSAIEARVLAWLANQKSTLQVFVDGEDIYKVAASSIFGVVVNQVTDQQRQVGKVAVLALGYQGGVGAFQTMAKGYNVKMEPAFETLWKNASEEQLERAEQNFKLNGAKFEISRAEFIASDLTKMFWRETNDKIVQYWYDIESASISAVQNPGQVYKVNNVAYKKNGSFLWCRLPSGGVICYPYPEIKLGETPWGEKKEMLTYKTEDAQSKKWVTTSTYGGSLVENITQAVARDLLAEAMIRLERKNYPVVIHVHDEIVCEVPENFGSVSEVEKIMSELPDWALGCPVESKGWRRKRYGK